MDEAFAAMVERLTKLGFSVYEAKTYIGLVRNGEETGYSLANLTGVPQPKVYETLRRLVESGMVIQIAEKPATYTAVPIEEVFNALDSDFKQRLEQAKKDFERLLPQIPQAHRELIWKLNSFEESVTQACRAISNAKKCVYLSGSAFTVEPLKSAIIEAAKRGVVFVVLHFGPLPFAIPGGRLFRHASTEGTLYFHHQARHLALVIDSTAALWTLARDGKHWQGLYREDALFASAIKGYIRHDIMVQRIYADLPEELTRLYGPGLQELAKIASSSDESESEGQELIG